MEKIISFLLMGILIISLTGCGKKEEAPAPKNYYCEEGSLKGNNCEIAMSEDAIQICEDGYQMIEDKCIKTETVDAKQIKTCEEGFTQNNDKCLSDKAFDKIETKECLLPSDMDKGIINVLENGHITSSSNQAYEKDGMCYVTIWKNYNQTLNAYSEKETTTIDFVTKTTCPPDTEEINGQCYKTAAIKNGYTCEKGELEGTKCNITDIKTIINTCSSEGFIYNETNNKCERINLTKALEK